MTRELLLGIDGGGSSTEAWLADRGGEILGRGRAGPSNIKSAGIAAALQALETAIEDAFQDARFKRVRAASACLGLAGADRAEDKEVILSWADRYRPADAVSLVNDGELVIAAGTPERAGVALIAGTGSIAVGRARDGRIARAGGWGHLFGDEGSAYGAAVAGLRLAVRRFDGRARSPRAEKRAEGDSIDPLIDRLCRAVGANHPSEFVTILYGAEWDRAKVASLAPAVVRAAEDDDEVRETILGEAGRELALAAAAVARALAWTEPVLPLAVAGSFVLGCPIVEEALLECLSRLTSLKIEHRRVAEPVRGAIALAEHALTRRS